MHTFKVKKCRQHCTLGCWIKTCQRNVILQALELSTLIHPLPNSPLVFIDLRILEPEEVELEKNAIFRCRHLISIVKLQWLSGKYSLLAKGRRNVWLFIIRNQSGSFGNGPCIRWPNSSCGFGCGALHWPVAAPTHLWNVCRCSDALQSIGRCRWSVVLCTAFWDIVRPLERSFESGVIQLRLCCSLT